ncbi:MAG: response regulator [Bacteroidetes bacterium]|nr:response regulator [Bacteroidota bacterium]
MKKTILLIDDCDMMRRFLTPIFKENYEVVSLGNAMEAVLWLKTNPAPDAILLDFELPEMSGMDLLKHIRQNDDLTNVPILMLSGMKDAERRWQCFEAGANDFLAKPFHPKELALRVNMLSKNAVSLAVTTA